MKLPKEIFPFDVLYAENREWFVYFLFKSDELIYIGKTHDIKSRLKIHAMRIEFDNFSFFKFKTESEALEEEMKYIKHFNPTHNLKDTGWKRVKNFYSFDIVEVKRVCEKNNIRFIIKKDNCFCVESGKSGILVNLLKTEERKNRKNYIENK